jgi:hypothetical protein
VSEEIQASAPEAQPAIESSAPAANPTLSKAGWGRAARSLLRQPRFLIAASLLLVCAVGFNSLVTAMQLHFRKLPLKLQVKALDDKETGIASALPSERSARPDLAPDVVGRWVQVGADRPFTADIEKDLGTKMYLSRVYVDRNAVHKTVEELRKLDEAAANELVGTLRFNHPESVIQLHMTYYTELADTVAHIPDRCYVASGYQPTSYDLKSGPAEYVDGKQRNVTYRHIKFEKPVEKSQQYVAYMFHCNGSYTDDPLQVRMRLQNLFETYGYYAKVELLVSDPGGRGGDEMQKKSVETMNAFLSALLPEVERCLPDWNKVKELKRDPMATAAQ